MAISRHTDCSWGTYTTLLPASTSKVRVADVSHDSHDLQGGVGHDFCHGPNPPPNGILIGKEHLCERLAEDRYLLASGKIVAGESPAGDHGNSHGLEEVHTDDIPVRPVSGTLHRVLLPLRLEGHVVEEAVCRQGQRRDRRRGHHAWKGLQPLLEPMVGLGDPQILFGARRNVGKEDLHGEEPFRLQSGIGPQESRRALHYQARTHNQNHGERDLCHSHGVSCQSTRSSIPGARPSLLQALAQIESGRSEGRGQSEQESRDDRDGQGEGHHAEIHPQVVDRG